MHVEMVYRPSAIAPEDSGGVSIIDHHDCAVFLRGLEGRFAQLGMRGQAQVIVRSEINDALAVEGALRRLFVLKYTQAKIGALGLEIIQLFGEIRKRIGSSSSGHEALRAEISLNDRSRLSP